MVTRPEDLEGALAHTHARPRELRAMRLFQRITFTRLRARTSIELVHQIFLGFIRRSMGHCVIFPDRLVYQGGSFLFSARSCFFH